MIIPRFLCYCFLMLILGIGNRYRSDDGVGIEVARRLKKRAPAGVTVLEASGEGTALVEAWQGAKAVILIDAVSSGGKPGTIHRIDGAHEAIPKIFFNYSTHAFGVAEAIELARALNQLPPSLVIYGIEGKEFEAGEELSPEVEKAATEVVKRILLELEEKDA